MSATGLAFSENVADADRLGEVDNEVFVVFGGGMSKDKSTGLIWLGALRFFACCTTPRLLCSTELAFGLRARFLCCWLKAWCGRARLGGLS